MRRMMGLRVSRMMKRMARIKTNRPIMTYITFTFTSYLYFLAQYGNQGEAKLQGKQKARNLGACWASRIWSMTPNVTKQYEKCAGQRRWAVHGAKATKSGSADITIDRYIDNDMNAKAVEQVSMTWRTQFLRDTDNHWKYGLYASILWGWICPIVR